MKTITYISKKSLGNIFGIFGVFSGLVGGIFSSAVSLVATPYIGTGVGGLGVLSLIILPIIYGGLGYLSGYVGASIYNKFIVPKLGGIEIELQ